MTEDLPLQDESIPASEPLATSGIPESDKKRVMIGSAIGGGIFLGVLIAIIVLVSTEEPKPVPPDPPKPDIYPHYNPYFVYDSYRENERLMKVTLINKRKEIENGTQYYQDSFGFIPIVKETYENYEPEYLEVFVFDLDEHLTRIAYIDPLIPRWRVPYFGNHSDPYAHAARYTHNPSGFKIRDKINGSFQWYYNSRFTKFTPLIDTHNCRLQYFDKYIEFEGLLDRDYIYGMGERISSFHLKNGNFTLWNRYYPADHRLNSENGMAGSHPFILNRLTDNQRQDFIGIFMRNSNAMMFSVWDNVQNGTTINFKMVGGIIDLFIFHTADPQYILRKYHSVIGRPYLPPIWAMGLQQARTGYTVADFENIIKQHQSHNLPVDALWADIEMNENKRTFTVNTVSFHGIKELVQKMHDHKEGIDLHFVAMANPWIAKDNTYKYYLEAVKSNCLIMSPAKFPFEPYQGQTLAGPTVWLDFFLHNATLVWAGGLHEMHEKTLFDGIWISENEIDNDCTGYYCSSRESDADEVYEIPNPNHNKSEFDYIPYRPTLDPLDSETLPMATFHSGDDVYHKQFYTHNLYGLQISQATFESLIGIFEDKRFLIASRSTWPGSGSYASHWIDANFATWESMASSIPSILSFNLFGIPHVGAPIGGYYFNTTDELLLRWFELGSFYPLMLSYSAAGTNGKEAFTLKDHIPFIKNALLERYSLIRFMYTKMFEAHLWGGAVVHPLFFDFTNDTNLYTREILDRTFMWASTLYIIPSLVPHQLTIKAYLPNWRWYDLRTLERVGEYDPSATEGHYAYFEQPLGYITVLIKGGSIVPYQHLSREGKIENTKDLELIPVQIVVAPDHEGKAVGSMIVDSEGIYPYPDPESNTYRHYTFTYMNQIFRINKLAGFSFFGHYEFDEFYELVILDNAENHQVDFVCMMDTYMKKKELRFLKSANSSMLLIHDNGMHRMSMYGAESIVWGSNNQHDFCKFQVHIDTLHLSREERVMTGTLVTSDPESYRLKYDFEATALTDHIVHFQVIKNEPGITEWRVPDVVSDTVNKELRGHKTLDAVGFGVSKVNQDFFFEMSEEHDPHDFLITTRSQPFVYVRNFIQVKFLAGGKHVFGLGERVGKFELGDGVYSVWNYDKMHEETGVPPGNNMYSSHPFYMIHTHNPFDFAGVFFLTSNPMDVRVKHIGIQTEMDHILSGGILELYLIGKGTAEHVVREYHYIIGKPHPLPFWAFGYHQSRWGYKDLPHLELMVKRFEEENLPLDGVWMDKDFMESYRSFTIDERKWAGLKKFVDSLHEKGKHFVAIVDAGIARDENFKIYKDGLDVGVYIKSNFTGEELVGITWAGYSVWVDFLNPASNNFWETTLKSFHDKINFDAIWLDMNEPSSFCDGECPDQMTYHYYYFPLDYYDDLYYNPTHRPLEARTISMEALHYGDPKLATEFNYHNMYPFYQARVTSNFFIQKLHKRPFIVSSSTYAGTGRYVSHWLGDNYSTWTDMAFSIPGMIHFGMFGIPFVGANICGYSGNATDQLCARWMQLGAYYPFMRNHNSPEGEPQEPYVNSTVKIASKHAILTRYSIVRYIYTEYMHTVIRGGTLIKPLTFLFPADNDTYTTVDNTFMLGPALHITPILEDNTDKVTTYFPNADWYTFSAPHYDKFVSFNTTGHKGVFKTVHHGLSGDTANVHIREGTIFPFQEVTEGIQSVLKLHDLPINLIIAPNHQHTARGEIFYDSEHYINYYTDHQDIEMNMHSSSINFNMTNGKENIEYNHTDVYIDKIIILGADRYQNTKVATYETKSGQTVHMKPPVYDGTYKILTLQAVDTHSMDVTKLKKLYWEEK
jgi:alpha-glucosidase (family GH31 glycosyl hydrolase)